METIETWSGETISVADARKAIVDYLAREAQSGRAGDGLKTVVEHVSGLPDGHERLRDLARWCISEGIFSLGPEAQRYVQQFAPAGPLSADLLLSQVISAQKREHGPKASLEKEAHP